MTKLSFSLRAIVPAVLLGCTQLANAQSSNQPTDKVHKLTAEQKQAIKDGRAFPGVLDFSKLSDEEAAIVYRHITGKDLEPRVLERSRKQAANQRKRSK